MHDNEGVNRMPDNEGLDIEDEIDQDTCDHVPDMLHSIYNLRERRNLPGSEL